MPAAGSRSYSRVTDMTMINHLLALNLLLGLSLATPAVYPQLTSNSISRQSDVGYRLNSFVNPSAYTITLAPYLDSDDSNEFTFDGQVTITITTDTENVSEIKLHSHELNFTASDVVVVNTVSNEYLPLSENALDFNTDYDFVTIYLASPLIVNTNYEISISYKGPIRSDLNGFYKSSYVENGNVRWVAATQMEPVHARKAFPCFDEPSYKATFTVIIDTPEGFNVTLANTKLQSTDILSNGRTRHTFTPTPIMSTYLVAFMVSNFEAANYTTDANGNEYGVWSRPDVKDQSLYALEIGVKVTEALGNFTGVDFFSVSGDLKMDQVGLPDFRAGAMENWGLIKYRETYFLYDPEESNILYKQNVATTVAHEIAHMWFGNLVTCHWWSNTWLNEGYANYFENYITGVVEPSLDTLNGRVTGALHVAMRADQAASSPALTNDEINSPSEISGHFGSITYSKGGSINRMIENLITTDAFKFGLNAYLTANQFNVGTPNDMYTALQSGAEAFGSLADYEGFSVESVMSTWVSQAGYPVLQINVDAESKAVTITQNRFYSTNDSSDELYFVPITYTTESNPDFENTKPEFILGTRNLTFTVDDLTEGEYIIFNKQVTGFYRVNYDEQTWQNIIEVLQGDNRTTIHRLNRAQIVDDVFEFMKTKKITVELAFEILGFLANETDYYVWTPAIYGLNNLRNSFQSTDSNLAFLDDLISTWLSNVIEFLGYDENENDDPVTIKNRIQILNFACLLGHEECLQNAASKLAALKNENQRIQPNLRPFAYCYGLQTGDESDYDFVSYLRNETRVVSEQYVITTNLGCTNVANRIESYLQELLNEDSEIRNQDINSIVPAALKINKNAPVVLQFFKDNYAGFQARFGSTSAIVSAIAGAIQTKADLDSLDEWISSCSTCSEADVTASKSAIESGKSRLAWSEENGVDLASVLENTNYTPSDAKVILPMFSLSLILILNLFL